MTCSWPSRRGCPYREIAEERGIKTVTVRNVVYSVQQKLEIKSMQGLVLWAVRNGLLDAYATEEELDDEGLEEAQS